MVVLTKAESGDYRDLAEDVAADRDTEVVTAVEDVDPDDEVVFVTPADPMQESRLFRIQRRLIDRGDPHLRFGIVTGRSPAEARSLYFDDEHHGENDCVLLRGTDEHPAIEDETTTTIIGEEVTTDNVERAFDEGLRSFSSLMNGKHIHAYLRDGYVCGFPDADESFDFDGLQPPCVVDGERDCHRDGTLLMADDLDARHLFLNACNPIIPNDDGMPVNLGLALLNGATSLIGSYRVLQIRSEQVSFHHNLLRSGYTAGERTYLLNRAATATLTETYPYVLFGRPETSVVDPVETTYDASIDVGDGEVRVELSDADTPMVDLRIDGSALDGDDGDFYLRQLGEEYEKPLFYAAFREGEEIRLLVYTWGSIRADSLAFSLGTENSRDLNQHVVDAFERARGLDAVGILPGKSKGQVRNARNHVRGATDYFHRESYHATVHRRIDERFDNATDSLANARRSLAESLRERNPIRLEALYKEDVYTDEVGELVGECPYCGRDVFTRTMADGLGSLRRIAGECTMCAYVFDVPTEAGETDPAYPKLLGDIDPTDQTTVDLDVTFTNPTDREMGATVVLKTPFPEVDDEQLFSSVSAETTLAPNEETAVTVEVDAATLDPYAHDGRYPVNGYVVTDEMTVYAGMRGIFVLP